jgi:endonuclease YncB( thermonuclease family)
MSRFNIIRGRDRAIIVGLAITLAAALPTCSGHAQTGGDQPAAKCRMATIGTGQIRAVRDGRTLLLDDGREVRLAGIEVPPPETAAGAAATATLEALAGGRKITLKSIGASLDRYSRVLAYVFVGAGDRETLLQNELLAAGRSWVAARIGDRACARDLMAAERTARGGKRGLWADPALQPRLAENPADILQRAGRFALVQGKVLSVRESGATIYLNFGRRWSEDFTVIIFKRNQRTFTAAGLTPAQLSGRRIMVRGIIERRGGPMIEAARPEQIEVIE